MAYRSLVRQSRARLTGSSRWALPLGSLALGAGIAANGCAQRLSAEPGSSESTTQPGQGTLGAGTSTLKIATWNLEWLNGASETGTLARGDVDYERLRKYADRLAADVIAVQEVDGEEALRRLFDDATYDYHVASQSGVQLTGFAFRSSLNVTLNPDYAELDVGGVRTGTDLTVTVNGRSLRLLSVHLKSGCFDAPLSTSSNACTKLRAQLPALERWIDARAAGNEAFVVLGDFNRRMKTGEEFYTELDDGDPANADLTLTTDGRPSLCWGGEYADFIDHIVLSRDATPWVVPSSFVQQDYDPADAVFKARLSDHCPLSVTLTPGASALAAVQPDLIEVEPELPPIESEPELRPIKGNINDGKKLYHLPGCPSYEQTDIDEDRGEQLFATEAEAVAAGWQKASNCP